MKLALTCTVVALCTVSLSTLEGQTYRTHGSSSLPLSGFGAAVAIADDEIIVGRPGELSFFPMPASAAGAVYTFRQQADGRWAQHNTLSGSGVVIGDGFGEALATDEGVLVVGAPKQNQARGAVYVFERASDTRCGASARPCWRETSRLALMDGASGDSLGFALAIDNGTLFVGSPGADGSRGAVEVFQRTASGSWDHTTTLALDGAETGNRFGAALSLEPGWAIIGAPGPHPAISMLGGQPQFQSGAALVFRRAEDGWTQEAELQATADGLLTFGSVVKLNGTDAFVSAPITGGAAGAVFHFSRDGAGAWSQQAVVKPTQPQPGTLFGSAVAMAGNDLVVGAPVRGGLKGTVYVFRFDPGTQGWAQTQQLSTKSVGLASFFGSAIATTSDFAVLGAPAADFFEGTGYLYARDASSGRWNEGGVIVSLDAGLEPVLGTQRDCDDGTASIFPCSEVDLVSFLPTRSLGANRGIMVSDVWGWTDPTSRKEYAIVGRFDGTAFVDVSDPARPVYLGELPLTNGALPNLWRDIKVYENHAFIVSDGAGTHGVQVFDLTQLRNVTSPPVTFSETARYDGIHSAHNIVINEESGFAYAVGSSMGGETCGGGLHMIDIRDPTNPTFAGCFADGSTGNAGTGYSHDAQCVIYRGPDEEHRGKEICFGANETALSIADVSDKTSPIAVSRASYPNVGYAHQGWLSEDQRFFFLNDELDEIAGTVSKTRTLVWDVEDLDDPVLLDEYFAPVEASDHNLYVRGKYMYQSNYVSGLRVIDVGDPSNLREVAFFDTVPFGEDVPGFAGSWSNYPFFESGNIVVTSMKEGLFVLRHREMRPIP